MTKQEMRIAIAEQMGWQFTMTDSLATLARHPDWTGGTYEYISDVVPNYPESLDACREFEDKLTDEEGVEYLRHLYQLIFSKMPNIDEFEDYLSRIDIAWALFKATEEQRCIAYLKTKGLWKK